MIKPSAVENKITQLKNFAYRFVKEQPVVIYQLHLSLIFLFGLLLITLTKRSVKNSLFYTGGTAVSRNYVQYNQVIARRLMLALNLAQ